MNSLIEKSFNGAISPGELRGVYTALITPMHPDGRIDLQMMEDIVTDQINVGIDGLVIAGTTGQSTTLRHDEQIGLVQRMHDYIGGETRLIAGAGSNSTEESIYMTKGIEDRIGATTFLHVVPYYNKPPQEGLFLHFSTIADSLGEGSNMILYNVPSRTGVNLEAKTTIELSKHEKIIGIKEASGNLEQAEEIIKNTDSSNFSVLSGEDHIVSNIVGMGGTGVISASANIAPLPFKKIVQLGLIGLYGESQEVQDYINPLVKEGVFCAANPIPLAHMFDTHLRSPLLKLDRIEEKVMSVLSAYDSEKLGIDWREYRVK